MSDLLEFLFSVQGMDKPHQNMGGMGSSYLPHAGLEEKEESMSIVFAHGNKDGIWLFACALPEG